MPKQKRGHIQFEGSVDNLTYFKSANGHIVRAKGGIDGKRIATDPNFERTRENNEEFKMAANAAKLFRMGLVDLMLRAKDSNTQQRVTKLMHQLKKYDVTSDRGKRQISIGLQNPDSKRFFVGFNFNEQAPMNTVLKRTIAVDPPTGVITISEFNPSNHLTYQNGVTHVNMQGAMVSFNFADGTSDVRLSASQNIPVDDTVADVVLTPAQVPVAGDVTLVLLRLEYFQFFNGKFYPFKSEIGNPLVILSAS
jgi:hypothetical protein